jgi:hypothetical protein
MTMLDGDSSLLMHVLQNACLISLSLLFLPVDSLTLAACYVYNRFNQLHIERNRSFHQAEAGFESRTILLTAVGMTKGLALARLFYETGHRVVGADFEPIDALVNGHFSKSLDKFYRLQKPSPMSGSSKVHQRSPRPHSNRGDRTLGQPLWRRVGSRRWQSKGDH